MLNKNIKILPVSDAAISEAADLIEQGQLVSFPTETVYGLGASCFITEAIEKVYAIKGRQKTNPLIVHFGSVDSKDMINKNHCIAQIREQFITNDIFEELAKYYIPGPLTLILGKKPSSRISLLCSNGGKKVAFRVPNHIIAQKFLHMSGSCVAPSANVSNKLSPISADHVAKSFANTTIPLTILDGGETRLGIESTVLDITNPDNITILRHGSITRLDLETLGFKINSIYDDEQKLLSPGMLQKHYSPNAKLRLNATFVEEDEALLAFGEITFEIPKTTHALNLSETGDTAEAAQNLFKMLWQFDDMDVKKIAVMPIPNEHLGISVNERLNKAAAI